VDNQQIVKQQEAALVKVLAEKPSLPAPPTTSLLTRLQSYNTEELRYCFGVYGLSFAAFANNIDLEHPDLNLLYGGQLTEDRPGYFGRDGSDLLKLASYGCNFELSQYVMYNLKRVMTNHEMWAEISKKLDDPKRNQLHIRFVKTAAERNRIRMSKRTQPVELRILYKKGARLWNTQPEDFGPLFRDEIRYGVELQKAMDRYQHFLKLGLTCMAEEVKKSVDYIEAKARFDLYLGYNKVTLTQAAIILGKMIGCNFHDDLLGMVCLPTEALYNFSTVPLSKGNFKYTPQAYCLHDMPSPPEMVKKILEHVEQMPELGGRPAFDHYRVVVPSFAYPDIYLNYRTVDGEEIAVETYADMKKGIDMELLKSGKTVGALLGERDGGCYFLGYWCDR
jgi:hypothetical protein